MNSDVTILPGVYRLEWDRALSEDLGEISEILPRMLDGDDPNPPPRETGQFPFVIVQFTNAVLPRPFVITSRRRASVSMAQAESIGMISGLGRSYYLSLLALLAMTQLRTFALNPMLEAEDVLYTCHPNCVFTQSSTLDEYALVLERKIVCGGCREFYTSLGAASEMASVLRCLGIQH